MFSSAWTCEKESFHILRIWHFSLRGLAMPQHVKKHRRKRRSGRSPLKVWFDKLPKESIDSYEDLRTAFRENYLQQQSTSRDSVEIHHIKPKRGELGNKDFMKIYKAEVLDVEGGTVTLQSSRVIPMECAMISGPSIQPPAVNQVLEEKINIAIHPEYPEQTIAIGSTLTEKGRKELCVLLKQNLDIFAWKPADMTGVPRNIAEHRLNIREGYSPVRQKKKSTGTPE
ncbi:hypothetical protein Tco_1245656 [Tanacetum coccineum]